MQGRAGTSLMQNLLDLYLGDAEMLSMLDESGAMADVRCRLIIVAQVDGHCKVENKGKRTCFER